MSVDLDRLWRLALNLPEVVEADHYGRPSFRIGGRILATVPDEHHLNVMVDEAVARAVADGDPDAVELLWWGQRLAGVRVQLDAASVALVTELLDDAWRRRAPARLRRAATSG